MNVSQSFIPYGAYWSSPFARWQGALSTSHALELAAHATTQFLTDRKIDAQQVDGMVLGTTVPQNHGFYGSPWVAAMANLPHLTGPTISQACATSVRLLATAVGEIETGMAESILGVAGDRTSNGPHIVYPNPKGIGGRGETEEWVWDNFNRDPHAGLAMLQTAENVASAAGLSREEQDAMALLRHQQYQESLADDRAFQRRYMLPLEIRAGKKTQTVNEDEGVFPTTAEGLAALKPAQPGGTVTFGTQTHPADGNAGMMVCTQARAKELSRDPAVEIRIVSFGSARVDKGMMPMAVVPAARQALERAGIGFDDLGAIKTHNPFAVNDVYFCKQTGVAPEKMNRFGSPLIYGHPQAPTGLRATIELIEELKLAGGGYGLFSGCAAGDTAMALVLKVG